MTQEYIDALVADKQAKLAGEDPSAYTVAICWDEFGSYRRFKIWQDRWVELGR